MDPYIGITGFVSAEEVRLVLQTPRETSRKVMIGVLATWKSLRSIPMKPKWQKQTPPVAAIKEIFPKDGRAINLVHFSTQEGQEKMVLADLIKLHELAGPNLHGFQLNLTWPDLAMLDDYRAKFGGAYRLVLQIGQKAVEITGGTPKSVVAKLAGYVGVVDDILLDPSGGVGKPFDTIHAAEFISAISDQGWGIGLGAAGGLSAWNLWPIRPLLEKFPNLSFDAQGRLRDWDGRLNVNDSISYLRAADRMITCLHQG